MIKYSLCTPKHKRSLTLKILYCSKKFKTSVLRKPLSALRLNAKLLMLRRKEGTTVEIWLSTSILKRKTEKNLWSLGKCLIQCHIQEKDWEGNKNSICKLLFNNKSYLRNRKNNQRSNSRYWNNRKRRKKIKIRQN